MILGYNEFHDIYAGCFAKYDFTVIAFIVIAIKCIYTPFCFRFG